MYIGKKKIAKECALLPEVKIKIVLGWAAFDIMRSPKSPIGTMRKFFNEQVLPVMS